ncbi:hypothetical protein [Vreelandella populi]|uniref:Uncharacterized protein n=1 Tax=Vreelandella populi TaxID=2498858 RepID=A0A3S0YPH0_9GAMM|nr:hypothetical protein [Halomonas populi]RUR48838.1 hypothetical protein ELY37_03030 [Halomonas populi]
MKVLGNEGMPCDELDSFLDDVGLLTDPVDADDQAVRENYMLIHRAIKLLLVSGNLDREKLAQAIELAENL